MKKQIVLQRGLILGLISMMVILMSGCFAGAITDEPYLGEEVSESSAFQEQPRNNTAEAEVTKLWLVDRNTALPSSFTPSALTAGGEAGGQLIEAAAADYVKMTEAMKADGVGDLYLVQGYRSYEEQEELYSACVQSFLDKGESASRAELLASYQLAKAGQDEHQTGLAVDVSISSDLTLSEDFRSTDQGKWLARNSWRYGFVYRYETTDTGLKEPWHLRYVGAIHGQIMTERGFTLEEYLDFLAQSGQYYFTDSQGVQYVIYYRSSLVENFRNIQSICGDNQGHYIITCFV